MTDLIDLLLKATGLLVWISVGVLAILYACGVLKGVDAEVVEVDQDGNEKKKEY